MNDFLFQSSPRLVFGRNKINCLPLEIKRLKSSSATFICDPFIFQQDFLRKLVVEIENEGINCGVFSEIESDPGFDTCDKACSLIREIGADIVIGIGGGSAMDVAKVAAAIAYKKESCKDVARKGNISEKGLPLILVPTTAGTGSEVTHISIFSDDEEKLKTGIVNHFLYADTAILDPLLTLGLPQNITAFSGTDAIIHALEALNSKLANDYTNLLAREALSLLFTNIRNAFNNGIDYNARSNMLYGSMLAGKAFANSSVAAIHAFAYPIGAEFHIPHGQANAIMLLPVLKFNLETGIHNYKVVAEAIGIDIKNKTDRQISEEIVNAFDNLLNDLKIDRQLSKFGITKHHVPDLAAAAMKVTRLMSNNPREFKLEDAERMYYEAL
ncbi:MAG: iron-containing alcohol dehydrogenase [Bacteroidales bacterium]|nr:iron-containing alcohol dehydrogenase [Bacteroidales bacterium]